MPFIPSSPRFEIIVTTTIFISRSVVTRAVVSKMQRQLMGGLLICLKKYEVLVRDSIDRHRWMSEIRTTSEGRKRFEVIVLCDGKPITGEQISTINRAMLFVDTVLPFSSPS